MVESEDYLNIEYILVMGSLGMLALTTAVIAFVYLYQRKLIKRKLAYQEIEDLLKKQELKSAYALLEGQDLERQRLAEELHDNLGNALVTLAMYADVLQKENSTADQKNLAHQVSSLARQASAQVRELAHRMDSGALHHFGLQVAIRDLINAIQDAGVIKVESAVDIRVNLTSEISLNLYRMLQELLNNTLKHAHATTITFELSTIENTYLSFIYEDNGTGFDLSSLQQHGMGLRTLKARVEKMNGQVSFEKKPTNGFSVVIEIPLT